MFSAFTHGTDHSRNRQLKAPFRQISNDFEPVLEPDAAAWYNTSGRKDGGTIDTTNQAVWETLTPEEKRRALYDRQVATLKTFLEHGVITQAQHGKSLHDLTEKMGYSTRRKNSAYKEGI
ncbi:MAG: hypothetical protein PUJ55_12600 [Clostridiales bacterium]|nr:hypothetical protein [Clostridiales bacterium]MDY4111893.1 hypothetical protein [Roseburia sp.]